MSGYTLNVDHWDWVNPEDQKVLRLRKGDDVPEEVLNQDGIDVEALSTSWRPVFLAKEDVRESGAQEASGSPQLPPTTTTTATTPRDKK